jgi:hypothetical protein
MPLPARIGRCVGCCERCGCRRRSRDGHGLPSADGRSAAERRAAASQQGSGGHPSQVRLARFLAHAEAIVRPVMAVAGGPIAAELIVGLAGSVPLIDGGRDLDNYLFPLAQRLGPDRIAAMFGRKIHGPSSLAVAPALPEATPATPQFATQMTGAYERKEWKQELHHRLRTQATAAKPGPVAMEIAVATGRPCRNCWRGRRNTRCLSIRDRIPGSRSSPPVREQGRGASGMLPYASATCTSVTRSAASLSQIS